MSEHYVMEEQEAAPDVKTYKMKGGKLYQGGTEVLYWQLTDEQKLEYFPKQYERELIDEERKRKAS